jgi:hypothetical protein
LKRITLTLWHLTPMIFKTFESTSASFPINH